MLFRHASQHPDALFLAGTSFLALGLVSLNLLGRWTHLSPDLTDGMGGLFLGIAISLLLLSLRMRRRRQAS